MASCTLGGIMYLFVGTHLDFVVFGHVFILTQAVTMHLSKCSLGSITVLKRLSHVQTVHQFL